MDGGWPESPPPVRPEHRSLWVALVWLSAGVECGLHACHLFAELPPGGSLSSGQLAEFFDLPAPYFSKHLQALSKAGIAVASPGPRGGYRLARLADEVTVLEVVEAIEGPAAAFRFLEIRQRGRAALPARTYRHPCAIAAAMGKAEAAWRQELKACDVERGACARSSPGGHGGPAEPGTDDEAGARSSSGSVRRAE
jgi:Rrf2 family protein